MIHSIIKNKFFIKFIVILFWLLLWQITAIIISEEILLVSPLSVMKTLLKIVPTKFFWKTILFSFSRILLGFSIGVLLGSIFASLSYKFILIKELLNPIINVIKAIPVASFVILILIWFSSKNLSIIISFLIVIPIIYTNILEGLFNTDSKLLEMSYVFKVNPFKKFIYIYIPQVMPFFISACSISIGLCWKSGIAAEVIGLPKGSIGEQLYQSKIFLNTNELFAWTIVVITISVIFEKIILNLIKKFKTNIERN